MERNDNHRETTRDAEPVFTMRQAADLWAYFKASLARRRWMFLGVTLLVVGLAVAAAAVLPEDYTASARVLAQDDTGMARLANPGRAVAWHEAPGPGQSAEALVKSRENLEEIVTEANLVDRWQETRPDLLRLKDQLVQLVRGPVSEAGLHDAVVGVLEDRLSIEAGDNGVITFDATWTDPETAARIADLAVQTFLEERKLRETGAIADTVAVLEKHATEQQMRVTNGLEHLRKARAEWARRNGRDPGNLGGDDEVEEMLTQLARIQNRLTGRRHAIEQVETLQAQQLAEMRGRLAELRTRLSPNHPDVVALQRAIQRHDANPADLEQMRREEEGLISQQQRLLGQLGGEGSALRIARAELEGLTPSERDDADVAYSRSRLEMAMTRYEDLLNRVSSAQIERDTAEAAFRYRYSTVTEPRPPERPNTPALPLVVVFGLLGGLALGSVSAVGAEASRERLLLPWQVERRLGLPFLGQVGRA